MRWSQHISYDGSSEQVLSRLMPIFLHVARISRSAASASLPHVSDESTTILSGGSVFHIRSFAWIPLIFKT
jgi:hypothetical protein